jgi:hypothetical protein
MVELSNIEGQSLPTVTNEYRSIGSGLEIATKFGKVKNVSRDDGWRMQLELGATTPKLTHYIL